MSKLVNEASIPALLEEMTPEEKVDFLVGKTAFTTQEMPKYGIPSILYLDGATGVNLLQYVMEMIGEIIPSENNDEYEETEQSSNESGAGAMAYMKYVTTDIPVPDTFNLKEQQLIEALRQRVKELRPNGVEPGCFPPGTLLGATWNPSVVYKVGEAVSREAMAYNVDVLLGTPNTNIHRDPKNGRLFESFSEDPYLSAKLAPVFSKAVQDQGMVADVKHFAANNQETLRQGVDELISERALREIYLPGFEATVKEGNVLSVMSAYNSINGVPCSQNHWLLTEVLKEEWGFEGQVVSDWGGVYDQVAALQAGNDLDMPGPRGKEKLYRAVESGTISLERLDDAVTRTLKVILKTPKFNGKKYPEIDTKLSETAAYNAAAEGITLLKNENVLPLNSGASISLFGKLSNRFIESGSGSAQVDTSRFTSLTTELARYTENICTEEISKDTEFVIITAGASGQEGKDRPDMDFDVEDQKMLEESIRYAKSENKKVILLLNVAGPVELMPYIDSIDALVCMYFPGMEGARAMADILFGKISPSGKLPITFPKTYRQTPTAINFPGEYGKVNYGEGIFVGYRYYDYKGFEPLYPFGFGLSFSKFSIPKIELTEKSYDSRSENPLRVKVEIKNEGLIEAKEVVQLYIHSDNSTLLKPEKELKGFKKVSLLPGESIIVTIELFPKDFASYDTQHKDWTVEPGNYEILVGRSSRQIDKTISVEITGPNPYGCSLNSTIEFIEKHECAVEVCKEVLGNYFDEERLKNNVIYFGSTPLKVYLEKTIPKVNEEEWERLLHLLEQKLVQCDVKK
ncbi:glycoside hydrolase family 3 N-terminal domain-containing protein [Agrilactobacillus yilanensis]|uniref:Glycoside hydrolase family 3 N-terminal domain-containing protein n=1 Tax=Agrilactobacillus yilanensis TaxID=2485997 RepID=A0ABW4J6B6_9LACO|nr:glycoside hydrolase family 3 N-terminal domain-containing protein [Agrilactobacillus yilanensis]